MKTPVSPAARAQFDAMPANAAVVRAWTDSGANPVWHKQAQDELRRSMPLLADALDRLARESRG